MTPKPVKNPKKEPMKKKPKIVLVRTYSAGVHVGEIQKPLKGREITLVNARRVWRWRGANTLSELSQQGAAEDWTRISEPVPSIVLTEVIEIIQCSEKAAENLCRSRWGSG